MELQVLVHGVDVIKDVVGDARDDPHPLGVVEVSLEHMRRNVLITQTRAGVEPPFCYTRVPRSSCGRTVLVSAAVTLHNVCRGLILAAAVRTAAALWTN